MAQKRPKDRTTHPQSWLRGDTIELLHNRVLAGDKDASNRLCRELAPRLHLAVRLRLTGAVDDHVIRTAVDDALLLYVESPSRYRPDLAPLAAWLTSVAVNKARDARRVLARRTRHEVTVGLQPPERAEAPADNLISGHQAAPEALEAVAKTDRERAHIAARLKGMNRVEDLADVLGLSHLSLADQRIEINREWVRLRTRARRRIGSRSQG